MAIGDVTKVICVGDDNGAEIQVVSHYETFTSFGPKDDELDGLADAFLENLIYKQLTNDSLDFMHNSIRWTELQLRDVDNPTIGRDYVISAVDGTGVLVGDPKAQQLAYLTRKKTNLVGRSYQGRNYWPFLSESELTGDRVNPPWSSDILDWYTTTMAIINVSLQFSFLLVVYSKTLGTAEVVTTVGGRGRMKTQRRRTD